MTLRGSFRTLTLYDVADVIRLDELRKVLGLGDPERLPFIRSATDYVRFERRLSSSCRRAVKVNKFGSSAESVGKKATGDRER